MGTDWLCSTDKISKHFKKYNLPDININIETKLKLAELTNHPDAIELFMNKNHPKIPRYASHLSNIQEFTDGKRYSEGIDIDDDGEEDDYN